MTKKREPVCVKGRYQKIGGKRRVCVGRIVDRRFSAKIYLKFVNSHGKKTELVISERAAESLLALLSETIPKVVSYSVWTMQDPPLDSPAE